MYAVSAANSKRCFLGDFVYLFSLECEDAIAHIHQHTHTRPSNVNDRVLDCAVGAAYMRNCFHCLYRWCAPCVRQQKIPNFSSFIFQFTIHLTWLELNAHTTSCLCLVLMCALNMRLRVSLRWLIRVIYIHKKNNEIRRSQLLPPWAGCTMHKHIKRESEIRWNCFALNASHSHNNSYRFALVT